jgi:2-oxoglutarate dehydrogenase E2 component (dihydrolipoamide succinyltransferase)
MSVEVVMPQMGESITEGTVSKWLKAEGDQVEKDEPVLEISTDKVDAEVPSPAAGKLLKIFIKEGETVPVGTALAAIGAESEAVSGQPSQLEAAAMEASVPVESKDASAPEIAASAITSEQTKIADSQRKAAPAQAESAASSSGQTSSLAAGSGSDAVEIVMPQMGESITEGTVSKWLKSPGDKVSKDEPLLEISTDKVDAEVPSPAEGTLLEIKVKEGETVAVGTVLAFVGSQMPAETSDRSLNAATGSSDAQTLSQAAASPAARSAASTSAGAAYSGQADNTAKEEAGNGQNGDLRLQPSPTPSAATVTNGKETNGQSGGEASIDELRRRRSSPLVRKIASQHGIDLTRIPGSGIGGRVTKKDILEFIETGAALRPEDLLVKKAEPVRDRSASEPPSAKPFAVSTTASAADRVEKMSVMRKKIAEHMTFSKRTSAHVTSVYEIDMTNVARFRERHKEEFAARYGTKLTFMPFIFQAVTNALRQYPVINAQVDGDNIIYKGDINLGMAVALDWGLIVPVIKRADTLSLSGLAIAANDLADRARQKKLSPDEVIGGTFTITNPGVFGGLFGTPIINQPQVAILCVGVIEKRPKVFTSPEGDDYIAIRQMAYFALTYDHRIVDGADAEKFLSSVKSYLENHEFSL